MRRTGAKILTLLLAAILPPALAGAPVAAAAKPRPSFAATSGDVLAPGFGWKVRTYAARCAGSFLDLRVRAPKGWRARVGSGRARTGGFAARARLDPGQAVDVAFHRRGGRTRRYHVRCLPRHFPEYAFHRIRGGGPRLFFAQTGNDFIALINRNGVPVWWFKVDGSGTDAKLLPDGTVSMNTGSGVVAGDFEIRTLSGRLVRRVGDPNETDVHDLQLLPNGNYVIGVQKFRGGVDASAYGGASDFAVLDTVIEEVTPAGETVRSWDSGEHIGLDETGRWWADILADEDALWYDISHWNAVDVDGRYMYLSFRNDDAIYKVDRKTGEIAWKLGGTETPESLKIRGGPLGDYPLGGQHDVRVQPNGTVTIFDNRTDLADPVPRAVRFRIDEDAGRAKLVESVTDEHVTSAFCCGSARRLPSKEWLVSWGNNAVVGAYDSAGRPIFRFRLPDGFTYRADPVTGDAPSARRLRAAMDRLYR